MSTSGENQSGESVSVMVFGWEAISVEAVAASVDGRDGIEVVAQASEIDDVARYARGHRPDVLIAVSWPHDPADLAGRMMEALADSSPATRVLVLGRETDAEVVRETLQTGANGYVLVMEGVQALLQGVLLASRNYAYVSHRMGCEIARISEPEHDALTDREAQVVEGIAHGYTNAELAKALFLSVRTIESHRRTIYEKLGFERRHEVVAYAIERGLFRPSGPSDRLPQAKKKATATMA